MTADLLSEMGDWKERQARYWADLERMHGLPAGTLRARALADYRETYRRLAYCPRHRPPFGHDPKAIYRLDTPKAEPFDCGPACVEEEPR